MDENKRDQSLFPQQSDDALRDEQTESSQQWEDQGDEQVVSSEDSLTLEDEFLPYGEQPPKKPRKKWGWKKTTGYVLLALLVVVLIIAGVVYAWAKGIWNDPSAQFTPLPTVTVDPQQAIDDYDQLISQADLDLLNGRTVNFLLVGVDYAEERETWSGKHAYHADVMMVLAVNFDKKTVDMISLPRDTYAKIPGVSGIYKLNASLDCGGGFPGGMTKVCQAASWMLGGIPVDYYYGVTMPLVKELVDAVGGVDYDVDLSFTMAGRHYEPGLQHMNGQAVLDYIRVRKNVEESGDSNRVKRQKKILVALFKKMQTENLWLKLPSILAAFNDKLMTNTTLSQTAALAAFAYKLPEESIGMHSMVGPSTNIFNWNFVITDQKKRVELIKQIYNQDVKQYDDMTMAAAQTKWAGMLDDVYLPNAQTLINYVQGLIDATPTPSPVTTPPPVITPTPATPTPATPTPATPTPATPTPATPTPATPTPPVVSPTPSSSGSGRSHTALSMMAARAAAVTPEVIAKLGEVKSALAAAKAASGGAARLAALEVLKGKSMELAVMVNHSLQSETKWRCNYEKEKNQIYVDFR